MLRFSLFLCLALFSLQIRSQSVIFVDSSATGLGSGTSWADAYTDLQPALEAAQPGDSIWVARGTYHPGKEENDVVSANSQRFTFSMRNGVKLIGGFEGTETKVSQRNWRQNPCILSGTHTTQNTHSYSVLNFVSCDSTSLLDGFEITGGLVGGFNPHLAGGGITIYYGNPVLINLDIHHNASSGSQLSSGGVRIFRSDASFINCFIRNNQVVQGYGGGIYLNGSSSKPQFVNCIFADNWAEHGGGGVYVKDMCFPQFVHCTFDGNTTNNGQGTQFRFLFGNVEGSFYNCLVNGDISCTMAPGPTFITQWYLAAGGAKTGTRLTG